VISFDCNIGRLLENPDPPDVFTPSLFSGFQFFESICLSHLIVHFGQKCFLFIYEKDQRFPEPKQNVLTVETEAEYAFYKDRSLGWNLEFCLIEIDRSDRFRPFSVRMGQWGSCPLYLFYKEDILHCSWDPSDLYRYIDDPSLDKSLTSFFLYNRDNLYSHKTLFRQIHRLTERATACVNRDGLWIDYPEPAPFIETLNLNVSEDSLMEEFSNLLSSALMRHIPPHPHRMACNLSGGLDSSTLCMMIAPLLVRSPLQTLTIRVMEEAGGLFQRDRIAEITEKSGFHPYFEDIKNHAVLSPGDRRVQNGQIWPPFTGGHVKTARSA